jgi:hypothetical protein
VYVQKKSCSLTSNGSWGSGEGSTRSRAVPLLMAELEVVTVEDEVETGIMSDWFACCLGEMYTN